MNLLKFLFSKSSKWMVVAALVGIISGISSTILIALINRSFHNLGEVATNTVIFFVVLCVLRLSGGVISRVLLVSIGQTAVFDMRMLLPRQILAAPLRHLESLGGARLLAILTEDVPTIGQSVVAIPTLCVDIAVVTGCLIYMSILSPYWVIGVVGLMLVGVIGYRVPSKRGMAYLFQSRQYADKLYRHFRAITEGAKELKIHGGRREDFLERLLRPTADKLRRNNIRGLAILSIATNWGQIIFFAVIGVVVFFMPGRPGINSELITGFVLVLLFMMTPLEGILAVLPMLGRANVALAKIRSLTRTLEKYVPEAEVPVAQPDSAAKGSDNWSLLELKDVVYTYLPDEVATKAPKFFASAIRHDPAIAQADDQDHERFTLGPLNLTFRPGELVFMIGGNGSGKSTFIKLLLQLYRAESGQILVDGKPVTEDTLAAYRRKFTVVFQDFFLFEEILGLTLPDMEGQARNYLHEFNLDKKLGIKDGSFTTTDLSRGQRKRLALLTAFLEDRSFYIFDEWAADQDPYFKKIFYDELLPSLKARNKAVLVISHDDQYHRVADRIIKLNYGQIEFDRVKDEQQEPV